MSRILLKRWTTDPEYIELFNYIINNTKDAKSSINIQQLIRDFKRISGTALTKRCLKSRIDQMRAIIHSFEHVDTETKVRMLFALSAPVNGDFLQKLSSDAIVVFDRKNRITLYKSERLELKKYHGLWMRGDTKNYWKTDPEYIDLLNFLIERTKNVKSPMNLVQLARDFKEKSGTALTEGGLKSRIENIRKDIQSFDHIDTDTKVRMLFALSVPVNRDFLQELSNDAHVEVDEGNRITHYKSECLELKGYHRLSTAYDIDLLNYLIKETENVKSPMSLAQLARDFKEKCGSFHTAESLKQRIIQVRYIIHSFEQIDTNTKVKLLFALSVPVNAHFLEKLKKCAFVKVDEINRITYYKAVKDGMALSGDHIPAAKLTTAYLESTTIMETPIKIEYDEPVEFIPETLHNSKTKFFEAMQSLILCLDTPSLHWIQAKIDKKIQKIRGLNGVILNNEIVQIVDLLIARIIDHSVVNISKNVESVNLSNFLCYLKASILNSKMSGMEGLVQNMSKLIEESQNKRIPMEKVANALRATLGIDCF